MRQRDKIKVRKAVYYAETRSSIRALLQWRSATSLRETRSSVGACLPLLQVLTHWQPVRVLLPDGCGVKLLTADRDLCTITKYLSSV